MSSDFYFRKWKTTLQSLEDLVNLDVYYQTTKAHDKTLCDAVLRLSAILGQYMTVYNHVVECLHQNLQVQKTEYIQEAVNAIIARMMELKHDLSKLEGSEYLFLSNGLIHDRITTHDAELLEIPHMIGPQKEIKEIMALATERANERMRQIELDKERGSEEEQEDGNPWWDKEVKESVVDLFAETVKELTEEEQEIKRNAELIQAQERARTIITEITHKKLKRQMWVKELEGTAAPKPSIELCERSAKIIQKVLRAYFECKRKRIRDYQEDELLGIRQLVKPKNEAQEKFEMIKAQKLPLRDQFKEDWKSEYEFIKAKYLKQKKGDLCESYRDHIRDWFYMWFEKIRLFYDIPDEDSGGSKLILTEEIPSPDQYFELYQAYLAEKKANKGKSSQQKKLAKLEAKREAEMEKKLEREKERRQNELKRKLLKNPNQHPGYDYPESKNTEHLLRVIEVYHTDWDEYDKTEQRDAKEKHCTNVDRNKAIMEVKLELIPEVDEDMRVELTKLKTALKKDYENNEEQYPEPMKQKRKKTGKKKKKHTPKVLKENIIQSMEELVFQGFVKDYPQVKLQDFIGDPNFYGDDVRCNYDSPSPFHGETRKTWWNNCRSMTHGFHRTLLVGPRGSGKTVLMHALATLNGAILFEIDPSEFSPEQRSNSYMQQVVQNIVTCARAAQPAVIHLKHVHRFYYKKVPPEYKHLNLPLFKRNFTKKLFKKILKEDHITVIGSCVDPWSTNSQQLLKDFSNIVLLPNTSYSIVVQILNDWVLSNHVVPLDLNVSCLAQVLKGYSFGYLKDFLKRFLNGDRIARISSRGLCPEELFESLMDENEEKPDYERYQKWYAERTTWGKREQAHQQEQREFKQALDMYALKLEMERKKRQK